MLIMCDSAREKRARFVKLLICESGLQFGSGRSSRKIQNTDPPLSWINLIMESVGLGFSNLTLAVHSSETVNKISMAYLLANITMMAATMGINLWVIQKKEKSRINRLIALDCFANIQTFATGWLCGTASPIFSPWLSCFSPILLSSLSPQQDLASSWSFLSMPWHGTRVA